MQAEHYHSRPFFHYTEARVSSLIRWALVLHIISLCSAIQTLLRRFAATNYSGAIRLDNYHLASQNDIVLREYLTPDLVATKLPGKTKTQVIEALLDIACRSGRVSDCELTKKDLLNHEREISTGMENGLAIPHAKSHGVEDFVIAIGVSKKKIDFESLDKKPAQVFVLTLSPIGSIDPHLRFLTEICTILKDKETMNRVVSAKTDSELYNVFAEAAGMEKVEPEQE